MHLVGIVAPPSFMDGWRAFDTFDEQLLEPIQDGEILGLVSNGHHIVRAWCESRGLVKMLDIIEDPFRLVGACLDIHIFWDGEDLAAAATLEAVDRAGRRATVHYFGPRVLAGPGAGPTVHLSAWSSRAHKAPMRRSRGRTIAGRQWSIMATPGSEYERGDGACRALFPSAQLAGPQLWPGNLTAVAGESSVSRRDGPVGTVGSVMRVVDGDTVCNTRADERAVAGRALAAAGWCVILDGAELAATAPGRLG